MEKPDWCPQNIWEIACEVDVEADFSFDGSSNGYKERQWTYEDIAKAIMTGIEKDRAEREME